MADDEDTYYDGPIKKIQWPTITHAGGGGGRATATEPLLNAIQIDMDIL